MLMQQSTALKLEQIFRKSLRTVQPENLLKNKVILLGDRRRLTIAGRTYPIHRSCHLIGFGKAVLGMALSLERILNHNADASNQQLLKSGIVLVPVGIFQTLQQRPLANTVIEFIEGAANNLPDAAAMAGTVKIKEFLTNTLTSPDDLLIVLMSGGGSALLSLPKPPITLTEKLLITKKLAAKGADITELNAVRKELSVVKGGGLAQLAYPARVVSLILSDVVGDSLETIASGPTVPNNSQGEGVKVLQKYFETIDHDTDGEIVQSIKTVLLSQSPNNNDATIISGQQHVDNIIIGSNKMIVKEAQRLATLYGFDESIVISTTISGGINYLVPRYINSILEWIHKSRDEFPRMEKRICLVAAGEPTVEIRGNGKGGRNQHLTLAMGISLSELFQQQKLEPEDMSYTITFLSCGTDGIDGPTDAAGAWCTNTILTESWAQHLAPHIYLERNDSYGFFTHFNNGANLIKTGHTGTNVMDLHLIAIESKIKS